MFVSPSFVFEIARVRTRPDVKRRLASVGAALAGIAATVLTGYLLVVELGGALLGGAARALVLLPRGVVWLTSALQEGANGWVIAGRVAAAAADAFTTPTVTIALIALETVAVMALFALRRLLRHEAQAESEEMRK